MPQIHLHAEPGDYAPLVLMPGDPNRATMVATMLDGGLEKTRLVNEHRKLMGYTGTWKGKPVSVQTSGIGTPSLAIVTEELLRLGARSLIRIGTCGAIGKGMRTGDLVVATASTPLDGTTRQFLDGEPYAPAPDFELTRALIDTARTRGLRPWIGPIASIDVFTPYHPDPNLSVKWRDRGIIAFEMESSALFFMASRMTARGRPTTAASILTVSDALDEHDMPAEDSYLSPAALEAATAKMIEVALEAGTAAQ
jgi:DeoD family purine-nucleoside phosphorylase